MQKTVNYNGLALSLKQGKSCIAGTEIWYFLAFLSPMECYASRNSLLWYACSVVKILAFTKSIINVIVFVGVLCYSWVFVKIFGHLTPFLLLYRFERRRSKRSCLFLNKFVDNFSCFVLLKPLSWARKQLSSRSYEATEEERSRRAKHS